MRRLNSLLVILIFALVFIGCAKNQKNDKITIGAILPLTGDAANYGISLKKGMDLAVKIINADSSNRVKIEVIYEDDKGIPNVGISAYNKLVSGNGVNYIIGGMFSNVALSLAPIVEKDSVILMSPTASAVELSNYGNHVFRIYPSDSYDGTFLASFCYNVLKVKQADVVSTETASTIEISKVFENKFISLGGIINSSTSYKKDETDFRAIIQKLKQSKSEIVFIPGYLEDISNILKQSRELNLNKKFITISTVYDKKFIEISGNTSEGLLFSAPAFDVNNLDEETKKFVKLYSDEFKLSPDILAAYGYDVVNLSYKAISESNNRKISDIVNNLYKIKDYPGVTGVTTFDKHGDVNKSLKILTIKNGSFQLYQ